jgi:hypothetical protein
MASERADQSKALRSAVRAGILAGGVNFKMTFIASEHVLAGGAWHGIKARSRFVIDPTMGALEVPLDLCLKLRNARAGQDRRPKFRL